MIGEVESWMIALVGMVLVAVFCTPSVDGADSRPNTQAVLDQLESSRGIGAIVGDTDARLALDLARASELVTYVQLEDAESVVTARRAAEDAGF